jgi:lipase chaperone LimK
MQRLTNEQKAQAYNRLLFQFQKVQEEIRLIQAENFEVSPKDQSKIDQLKREAKRLEMETRKLYL